MSWAAAAAAAAAGSSTYHGGGRSPWSPWGAGDAIVQVDKLRNDGRGKQAVIIILYYIRVTIRSRYSLHRSNEKTARHHERSADMLHIAVRPSHGTNGTIRKPR